VVVAIFAATFTSIASDEIFTAVAVVSFVILNNGKALGICLGFCDCLTCAQESSKRMLMRVINFIQCGLAINKMARTAGLHKRTPKIILVVKKEC
jgi:hypothetical protein